MNIKNVKYIPTTARKLCAYIYIYTYLYIITMEKKTRRVRMLTLKQQLTFKPVSPQDSKARRHLADQVAS